MTYTESREDLLAHAQDLISVVEDNAVRIDINQTFPLAEAARAHRELEARKTTGSTILLP
jgi:NADPH2:quinone reductase